MNESILGTIQPIRHGLFMAVLALLFGALWAAYMATHHEQLHGAFEAQVEKKQQAEMKHLMEGMDMETMSMDHSHSAGTAVGHHQAVTPDYFSDGHDDASGHEAGAQHSHSGSLAKDAMQRLLRGHIHFMGIGVLAAVLLLITAFTSLKNCWKYVLGFTFGIGALAYPPAWILMGFRTVELGPEAAEASVMWLFGPAVALLMASMAAVSVVLLLETLFLQNRIPILKNCFIDRKGG
ncbi:hypothetical protein MMIC_P1598 [Mariprofundus micogutta]|uniref:Uncharacterized protein n=1 Tax=Mariprofundus micogutta TaxID=1921010 RepID=A0A1L8CNY0_9PROT|nr:hypothetical protein [Mariprofundus micogutta]GAV20626.1 hypothetical protein MMIC_P1598 [Mariprofundus micogutta]